MGLSQILSSRSRLLNFFLSEIFSACTYGGHILEIQFPSQNTYILCEPESQFLMQRDNTQRVAERCLVTRSVLEVCCNRESHMQLCAATATTFVRCAVQAFSWP